LYLSTKLAEKELDISLKYKEPKMIQAFYAKLKRRRRKRRKGEKEEKMSREI